MIDPEFEQPRVGIRLRGEILNTDLERAFVEKLAKTGNYHKLEAPASYETARIYTEGLDSPLVSSHSHQVYRHRLSVIDQVFQEYIRAGNFYGVTDDKLRAILQIYALEKLQEIPWYQKTYRLVHARPGELVEMPGDPHLAFILTQDKSDI